MKLRLAVLACLALALSGCALRSLDPEDSIDVGNGVSVTPQPGFAQVNLGFGRYWTVNGVGLDELHFYTGIKSGQPLFAVRGAPKNTLGVYDSAMPLNDIEDLLVATMRKKGYQNARSTGLSPCPFGSAPGFCFSLSFADENGLEMRGRVLAARRGETLDLLLFFAPAEYYFAQLSPAIDRIFASLRFAAIASAGKGG